MSEYEIAVNSSGAIDGIRKGGHAVPLDDQSQEFCDFLTWGSQQSPRHPALTLVKSGTYFADGEKLVNFCKDKGVHLYVSPSRMLTTAGSFLSPNRLDAPFYELQYAVAHSETEDSSTHDGTIGAGSAVFVTSDLFRQLARDLTDPESNVRRLSTWPVEKTFVYFDISDYSKYPPGQQTLVVNSLLALTRIKEFWFSRETRGAIESLETSLCIGDGYIFVLKNAFMGLVFASHLASLIEAYRAHGRLPVAFHFRASVHVGPVFRFWDWGREDWNYIGDGINGGQRVLTAIGRDTDDVLFVSAAVRDEVMSDRENIHLQSHFIEALQNRGRRADKHGRLWRVYEVNHTGLTQVAVPHWWSKKSDDSRSI